MPKLAIVGDIHLQFNQADIDYFNHSEYDLILLTGDLGEFNPAEGLKIAEQVAELTKPALFIPGNHDVANYFNVAAEVLDWHWLEWMSGLGRPRNVAKLEQTLKPVICGGYSTHQFELGGMAFDVIVGRPFSMGGNRVSFPDLIAKLHGVMSMDDSVARLKACVQQAQSSDLIFLAHGGPTGCGDQPTDPWGKDFGEGQGDHGEPDLAEAIDYARTLGKRVIAVVAGHMHHLTKQGLQRRWYLVQDGTCYINGARVPRIFTQNGAIVRHHIGLQFDQYTVTFTEELI
ncbi:MAG: metallophosphoesterase [Chloroflexota bacterium]